MTNYVSSARCICPFYVREARKSITCEGITPGVESVTRFDSEYEKRKFQEHTCEMFNYKLHCELARKLAEKYSEENDQR